MEGREGVEMEGREGVEKGREGRRGGEGTGRQDWVE